jgi:hypothetical protein
MFLDEFVEFPYSSCANRAWPARAPRPRDRAVPADQSAHGKARGRGGRRTQQPIAAQARPPPRKRSERKFCAEMEGDMPVSAMLDFDAEAARQVEAVYLTADVVRQRREVLRLLALTAGEAVLDLGGWWT